MWPFKKQVFSIEDYKTILKRFEDVESRVRSLELEQEDFRNKVLRKIQTIRKSATPLDGSEDNQPGKKSGILSKAQIMGAE